MKIVFAGGGTFGSVIPLLALAEKIKEETSKDSCEFLWLGTRTGPEKFLIKNYQIKFQPIFSGKFRRYFSFKNILDIFKIFIGFFQSFFILQKFKPDVIVSAGGFVSFPVVIAGWCLRIPALIHQQDIVPSLTNKLLSPFAQKITVVFEKSLKDFPRKKTILIGNPVRQEIFQGKKERAISEFQLEKNLPVILIIGGGTGALRINQLVVQALPKLVKFCQIIHLTGGKLKKEGLTKFSRYHSYDFLTDRMKDALAAADLVISRAGLSTLTELSFLGKPTILIPIPNSHQEKNAQYFQERGAAVVLPEKNLTPDKFVEEIRKILFDQSKLNELSERIKTMIKSGAEDRMIKIIFSLIKND